jgi:putative transposase
MIHLLFLFKMTHTSTRISWSTNLKQYVSNGYYDSLPTTTKKAISSSNKSRWVKHHDKKYYDTGFKSHTENQMSFYNNLEDFPNVKNVLQAFFELNTTFHEIMSEVKGIKKNLLHHKEKIVNTIEKLKNKIPVEQAIKIFNISRSTYHNYKILVLNKCDASYFKFCLKQYPSQLLQKEIEQIKKYMNNLNYRYWSKSSIYLLALRNKDISIGLSTWYKYCNLLGYKTRHLQPKIKYNPIKSDHTNQIWCADVTILKTQDGTKHYIHLLIDHFSRKILAYSIQNAASPKAIKDLLELAYANYNQHKSIQFLTDAGLENINPTVKEFIASTKPTIIHLIAQKDITQSNSQIEAINKIIKHQLLLPKQLENKQQLTLTLPADIAIYNDLRPQLSLGGNTPSETYSGKTIILNHYKTHFPEHKIARIKQNKQNNCQICVP